MFQETHAQGLLESGDPKLEVDLILAMFMFLLQNLRVTTGPTMTHRCLCEMTQVTMTHKSQGAETRE